MKLILAATLLVIGSAWVGRVWAYYRVGQKFNSAVDGEVIAWGGKTYRLTEIKPEASDEKEAQPWPPGKSKMSGANL